MRGTIRARGKGRWQIQVYAGRGPDGREHRVARTIHGKRADADQALRQLIREVEAGQHRGDDPTVTQLAEQWYTARSSAWSPRTRTTYRATVTAPTRPIVYSRVVESHRCDSGTPMLRKSQLEG